MGEDTGIGSDAGAPSWLQRTVSLLQQEEVAVDLSKLDAMEKVSPKPCAAEEVGPKP